MQALMNFLKSVLWTFEEAYSHREKEFIHREVEEGFLDRADDLLVSIRQGLKAA